MDKNQFKLAVEAAVKRFPENNMAKLVDEQSFTMTHYHDILRMIFHQTFRGPSTFALASAYINPAYHNIREYLIHHAEEEKTHWQWVIGDLKNTGYQGIDPREEFPRPACEAYIAFNYYTATTFPLGRLAIAIVLESIGATYGKHYATKIVQQLGLKEDQVVFFFGHGDTDVGHTKEIYDILDTHEYSSEVWSQMAHIATTAGVLYKSMYDEAVTPA